MEVTLQHEGDNVREFYSSLPRPVRVGIEATGSMQWFLNLMWKNWESNVWSAIRHRFAQPSHGSRNMIGEMCGFDSEVAGRKSLSGDLAAFEGATGSAVFVAGIVISGYACGREYKMRCSRLPWRMASDEEGTALWSHDGQSRIPHHCRWRPHTALSAE